MVTVNYVTEEGLQRLRKDLEQLKNVERPKISQQIAEARDKGDLSENAEYDAAKEAQGLLELRISNLEAVIAKSRIIDESKIDTSQVQIMTKVELENITAKTVMEYTLVAESEANIKEKKLSISTPIAKSLLGKKIGDVVEAQVPSGTVKFKILKISR
jgi:transcription elongation factor GreA